MENRFASLPTTESVRLIDFEHAEVVGGIVEDKYILIVSGTKPYLNMTVELSPRVYVKQPEYWGIEVIGSLPGYGLPAEAPYSVSIPLDGILGTKGIEVIGASSSKKIDVPETKEPCNEAGDVIYRANQVPGAVVVTAQGSHLTSGYRVYFQQSPIDVFPPEFILFHERPEGIVLQVKTPFFAHTHFNASEEVKSVTVHDAQGAHKVKVEQTPE